MFCVVKAGMSRDKRQATSGYVHLKETATIITTTTTTNAAAAAAAAAAASVTLKYKKKSSSLFRFRILSYLLTA
jgi:hypothetical protein